MGDSIAAMHVFRHAFSSLLVTAAIAAFLGCGSQAPVSLGGAELSPSAVVQIEQPGEASSRPDLEEGAAKTWKNGKGPLMRLIPEGSFLMGSNDGAGDERPIHSVTLQSFYLDETEVTVGQYEVCVDAGACDQPESGKDLNWGVAGRASHPVNGVGWYDATKFCAWADKELPSEEQWEYASRRNGHEYPWGSAAPENQLCWDGYGNDQGKGKRQTTCIVGSYPDGNNAEGVSDLVGNVWEWTRSNYCPYTSTGRKDCDDAARCARGGAWSSNSRAGVGGTLRGRFNPTFRPYYMGFRCSRSS